MEVKKHGGPAKRVYLKRVLKGGTDNPHAASRQKGHRLAVRRAGLPRTQMRRARRRPPQGLYRVALTTAPRV